MATSDWTGRNPTLPSVSPPPLCWTNIVFFAWLHLAAAAGAIWYFSSLPVTLAAAGIALFFATATGLSIGAGYHRLFAHASYEAHPAIRALFLFFGAGAFQASALRWASDHRNHHRYTDRVGDPYSIRKGFWWAHMGWLFVHRPALIRPVPVSDLERDRLISWQSRYYLPIAIASGFVLPWGLGALAGDPWGGLVHGGFLRMVLIHHVTFCINSLAHTLGSQPYSEANTSRDSAVTALFTFGEGYHNFHHAFPYDYRNGVRFRDFDPNKWLIWTLQRFRLARGLVRAREEAILKTRIRMQEARAARMLQGNPPALRALQRAREEIEHLADRWAALREQWAELRNGVDRRSQELAVRLRQELKQARRRLREAYRDWRILVQNPAPLPSLG